MPQGVTGPGLDESVTDLNFVTKADVDPENRATSNFDCDLLVRCQFLVLDGGRLRRAVSTLDWVEGVTSCRRAHVADKINAGLAKGLSFQETFGVEADGSLDELRRTFLVKAFQRRQVAC